MNRVRNENMKEKGVTDSVTAFGDEQKEKRDVLHVHLATLTETF